MSNISFVLSDETTNSYGMIIKTQGINLQRFAKNPIMFYAHDTGRGAIGLWRNIRVVDNQLIADADFYDDAEADKVRRKVEKGFLRGCSVGIEIVETDGNIVTKCVLLEASVCDLPSNENALRLFYKNTQITDFEGFCKLRYSGESDFKTNVCKLFEIDTNTNERDVINTLREKYAPLNNRFELALQRGLIEKSEEEALRALIDSAPLVLSSLIDNRMNAEESQITMTITNAFKNGKLYDIEQVTTIKEIGKKIGAKLTAKLIEILPERISLLRTMKNSKKGAENGEKRGLLWYRKNAPQLLEENSDLFETLLEEFRNEQENKQE